MVKQPQAIDCQKIREKRFFQLSKCSLFFMISFSFTHTQNISLNWLKVVLRVEKKQIFPTLQKHIAQVSLVLAICTRLGI